MRVASTAHNRWVDLFIGDLLKGVFLHLSVVLVRFGQHHSIFDLFDGLGRFCHHHLAPNQGGQWGWLSSSFSLYKIFFHFKALLWEYIILLLPSPHQQRLPYCNTIARQLRNTRPATDPPFVYHTPINIGDANIV